MTPPDPKTPEQWQLAVDAAEGCLAVEYMQCLGLFEGGKIDADRCAEIIERGAAQGITPSEHAIRDTVVEFISDEADREKALRVVKKALSMSGNPPLAEIVPFLSRGRNG